MAAPNLLSLTTITPTDYKLALTSSAADVVTCASSHAVLIFELLASNVTAAAHPVSCFYRNSSTNYSMETTVSVPANSTIDLLNGNRKWIVDGDSIQVNSDASSQIVVTGSGVDCS